MKSTRHQLDPHMQDLLAILGRPLACVGFDAGRWDRLVRVARAARLLGVLAARIESAGLSGRLPEAVVNHLRAATAESNYLRQMTLRQLSTLAETLCPLGARLVALKGSAYIVRGSTCAAGRMPRDVDIMVERHRLDEVEAALSSAGWVFDETDPYDQHYYRAWSHELPPMRAPAMPLELDVHHTILPPLGRLRPDPREFFATAVRMGDGPWWTLSPVDLVLHASVHLIQDSDWESRLRDLVDIDCLLREGVAADPGFGRAVVDRAATLGLGQPLWYVLELVHDWFETPVGISPQQRVALAPPWPARVLVLALARRCLSVVHPDCEPGWAQRFARAALSLRALWLRMPPRLVVYHGMSKVARALRRRREAGEPGE